jgi:lysozyme
MEKYMENKYAELIIKLEESYRQYPYYCSEKFPTVGYGERVGNKGDPLPNISRTEKEALQFLRTRIKDIVFQLSRQRPKAWNNCNEPRQAILISMVYQLGMTGVLKFNNMWAALERNDFDLASKEMLDSLWAKQTKNRALRHSKTMKDGSLDMYYLSKGTFQ